LSVSGQASISTFIKHSVSFVCSVVKGSKQFLAEAKLFLMQYLVSLLLLAYFMCCHFNSCLQVDLVLYFTLNDRKKPETKQMIWATKRLGSVLFAIDSVT